MSQMAHCDGLWDSVCARYSARSQQGLSLHVDTAGVDILVVDDEPAVREALERSLRFEGYEVALAEDGAAALEQLAKRPADAVVLDVLMPRLDGLETCRRLRARGDDVPVLMLTARDTVSDRVSGLDAGADDYLVKPFALEELLARLRALLRRTAAGPQPGRLTFADLTMDLGTYEVRRADRALTLTRTEFTLLELFMRNPRLVLQRSLILERVWGFDFETSSNSLEVYVSYLRRKLEADGEPRLLHTVRGVGYVLREDRG
jgi:two-component system response regulator MprA